VSEPPPRTACTAYCIDTPGIAQRQAFKKSNEAWWQALPLSPTDKLQIRHLWLTIHHLNDLLDETEAQIAQQSVRPPWAETMTFLLQLPGIGLYTGMTILAAIGDITRFPRPGI